MDLDCYLPDGRARRMAAYSLRAPALPHIHVPNNPNIMVVNVPEKFDLGIGEYTDTDIKQIVQWGHRAYDKTTFWKYEYRRAAQMIVPFLYLGPAAVTKDKDFLRETGITMLLAVRDSKSAQARILNVDNIAAELGIASATLDVSGPHELIAGFPRAIKAINEHLLSVYRSQKFSFSSSANGGATSDDDIVAKGKVFIFCETGNERSASVAVAYMMSIYKMDLSEAAQLVQSQRFCVGLDDNMRNILLSWNQLLQARRDVSEAESLAQITGHPFGPSAVQPNGFPRTNKRRHEETLDDDTEVTEMNDDNGTEGRRDFAPFL